jgi:enoyl-CoA hydratase/carnithine racemase
MTTGRRYGGTDALAAGIVDAAVAEDAVRPTAVQEAAAQARRAGPVLGTIKSRLHGPALALLREPAASAG